MGHGTREAWICDICGHAWLIGSATIPPVQCLKCGSTLWNYKAERLRVVDKADMTPEENQRIAAAMDKARADDLRRRKRKEQ